MKRKQKKRDLALEWCQQVYEACGHRCAVCGYEGPHLEAHHVIEQGRLRRAYAEEIHDELLWNPDNGLLLCAEPAPNRCHNRHTLAVKRIPRSCLRAANEDFAERIGMGWVLDRFYPLEQAA